MPTLAEAEEHDEQQQTAEDEGRHRVSDEHAGRGEPVDQAPRPGRAEHAEADPCYQPQDRTADDERYRGWQVVLIIELTGAPL